MRIIFYILFLSLSLFSDNLEITSDNFYFKDGDKKAKFSGHVVAKTANNVIKANTIIVYLNDKSEAIKYEVIGNVNFKIKDKNKDIVGSSNKLIYIPDIDKYTLIGNVYMNDLLNKREVFGDKIVIDNKNKSSYAISNSKKPVKFIFQVKSKK